ncbi:MAG: twin-arginine translocase subunit TatC [Longimicrobiales bacterium]
MDRLKDGLLSRGGANPRGEMPFLDHLEELRWRILWSLVAIGLFTIVGFVLVQYFQIVALLREPGAKIFGDDWMLIYLAPTDAFFLVLKLAISVGVILASPVIVYQIWSFLSPALEKHEKRAIVPALYMGLVLFAAGVAMAYFIALPISLRFLLGFLTEFMTPTIEATRYMSFVIKLLLGFGIVFELPVVILILSALGLVTPKFLRAKRRHAIVIITVLASFLSPGDVIAVTVLMMVPLIFLYEFSILLSVLMWRRRDAKENTIVPVDAPEGAVSDDDSSEPDPDQSEPDPDQSEPNPDQSEPDPDPSEPDPDTSEPELSPYTYGDPAASGDADDEEE